MGKICHICRNFQACNLWNDVFYMSTWVFFNYLFSFTLSRYFFIRAVLVSFIVLIPSPLPPPPKKKKKKWSRKENEIYIFIVTICLFGNSANEISLEWNFPSTEIKLWWWGQLFFFCNKTFTHKHKKITRVTKRLNQTVNFSVIIIISRFLLLTLREHKV